MMDYKSIADADPGGDLAVAAESLRTLTTQSAPEFLMTYKTIANAVGFSESAALEVAVNAAISGGQLPSWVSAALNTGGIDVNNPQTSPLLISLIGQTEADKIIAAGAKTELSFKNLKNYQLAEARRLRGLGEI